MNLPLLDLAVLALHLLGLTAATHAVMHTRTPQGAFAWALGLVLLPWLTLLPYLYLGRHRFRGYINKRRFHHLQFDRKTFTRNGIPPNCERYSALCHMLHTAFHPCQQVRLLIDGEDTFRAIFEAIAKARHYILVQFFIINDDELGRHLQGALLERAAAGIRICVLYDGIGSYRLPRHYIYTLRDAGVSVHPFATQRHRNRFQLNFRNHRKLVVVDGEEGFVGGLNVGDAYPSKKPPLAPWRDTHLALHGSAVDDLQHSFAEDWHWVTGAMPPMRTPAAGSGHVHTLIAATGPADPLESCSLLFVTAIHAARRRLWLTTPYFVPDRAVTAALQLAVLRGVDVRVLIPARGDHRTVFLSSRLHAHHAVRAGIRVFAYRPGFMHQKVVLVDDDTATIGSMNLDSRSFRLNFEIAALNVDRRFAAEVERMLREDFSHAVEISPADYKHTPWHRQLAMHVARLLDPVL